MSTPKTATYTTTHKGITVTFERPVLDEAELEKFIEFTAQHGHLEGVDIMAGMAQTLGKMALAHVRAEKAKS